MKKVFFIGGMLALLLGGCQSQQPEASAEVEAREEPLEAAVYGATISPEGARPVSEVPTLLQTKDSVYTTLEGKVLSSCAKKGCWMMLDLAEGDDMRVSFKEYAFFVPKDLNGQEVVVEGMLRRAISSVEEQRHFAEDAGKSAAEVAAIQQPDTVYSFEAVGVLIYPKQP